MQNVDIVIPCYNPGIALNNTLSAILDQNLEQNWKLKIIAVDDASTDNSFNVLKQEIRDLIHEVKLVNNKGRSAARNIGANSGNSDYIVFLDCDCEMQNQHTLNILLDEFKYNNNVIYGSVKTKGNGFWAKYFNAVSLKREHIANNRSLLGFSSQYFAVTRREFELCSGFDENFYAYGFEDRDLILRLKDQEAKIKFKPDSVVFHEEVSSLSSITNKLSEAGQHTSVIFEKAHPETYRKMIYGKIDARIHPYKMVLITTLIVPFLNIFVQIGSWLIKQKYLPYFTKVICVKFLSALSYIKGTSIASK